MRVSRAVAALVLVIGSPLALHAQFGRVGGTVKDEEGRGIKGATVTAVNPEQTPSSLTASTNDKGQFSVLGLRRGVWTFTISAPGYDTVRVQADVATVRPNPPVDVRLAKGLAPAPMPLAGASAEAIQAELDRARSRAESGDLDGALADYRELLARVPALTSIQLQIGALCERRQDTEGALAAYRKLLESDPANVRARQAVERLARR